MERLTNKREADAQREEYERHLANGYPRDIHVERLLRLAAYEDTGLTPEEATVSRWIPVTERLPEDDATVLTYKNGIVEVQKYEKRRNGWICKGWFWSLSNVTHWMPLPEPPKEASRND